MMMYQATEERIHQFANERHRLYRQAGKARLSPAEQERLRYLNDQLPLLWDQLRREWAMARHQRATPKPQDRAA